MSLRRVSMAGAVVCGLCVWGFAGPDDEPARARGAAPVQAEVKDDEGDNRDEAAARYRANQSGHWRHVAAGSSTNR